MRYVLLVLGVLLIVATALSLIKSARWWIRVNDFPRLQIAVGLAVVLAAYGGIHRMSGAADWLFALLLAGALLFQLARIFPYLPVAPKQVVAASPIDPDRSIRLLISNVLMENRRAGDLLRLVEENDPDLILVVETDDWWNGQLAVLEKDYPYSVRQPQQNYYGMLLFSRLELLTSELRFLVEDDIPSIRATVRLRSGDSIDFFGLHPRPPDPGEDTEERDAEILIVGKEIKEDRLPAIVAGDLNDVAWSRTTRLFQRISGALDPRRGRGMFSTFHADYPIFRWPLDHIFHEESFTLVNLKRLRSIGSDHFPVFAELQFHPAAADEQEAPEADTGDREEARESIEEGREAAEADRREEAPARSPS